MNELAGAVTWVGEESSLISLLKVVANVQECRPFEDFAKASNFGIARDHCREPIVCNADRRKNGFRAAELEASFGKNSHLSNHTSASSCIRVWTGEYLRVVKENNLDPINFSLMHSKSVFLV
jgi:hypothetical protein